MTADMLSWLRQQIEARKALAEAASGESWTARRVVEVGYMVADEDSGAAVARLWVEMADLVDGFHAAGVNPLDTSKHIAFNGPRQIIADCKADLAILDLHEIANVSAYEQQYAGEEGQPFGCRLCHEHDGITVGWGICETLRILASRYRHRPGYLPEWAPEGATP